MNLQMGVPTDCAQRQERLGWGADAAVSAEEAMLNLDMARLYAKWMWDFQDSQAPSGVVGMMAPRAGVEEDLVWSTAYVDIPWRQYLHYGDVRILKDHYASLARYMDYLATQGRADLRPRRPGTDPTFDPLAPGPLGYLQLSQWGDHLALAEGFILRSGLPLSISTAFYYHNATVMEKIARVLGETQDAEKYKKLASAIRNAFNHKFSDSDRNRYDDGSQAAQAFALSLGLAPEEKRPEVMKTLLNDLFQKRGGHLTTGLVGTSCLVDCLTAGGRPDVVWHLATIKGYPSWNHMLEGMTTVKEDWPGKGSFSHVGLAAPVDAWFYTTLAGIRVDDQYPGYECIAIKPYIPSDLDWVNAWVDSIRGRIASSWRKENGVLRLDVTIPANTTATVHMPTSDPAAVTEGGRPAATSPGVTSVEKPDGEAAIFRVQSGRYNFVAPQRRGQSPSSMHR